jgi:dipeptidyl aminopeptidase/acylaminoacyl peptidase
MNRRILTPVIWLAGLSSVVPAAAQTIQSAGAATLAPAALDRPAAVTGAPTIDQSLSMRTASAPRISPDGRWVVYEVSRTNWEANAFERDLWLVDATTGSQLRLAGGKGSSYDARWSPDGQWVAFLSNRPPLITGGKAADSTQIYLIARAGGEARQLTHVESGVSEFEWSPTGSTIAFTTRDAKSPIRKLRDSVYGEIAVIGGDYSMTRLWTLDVTSSDSTSPAEPRRLTQGDSFTVNEFRWSPDGMRIAFTAQRDPDLGSQNTTTIYVVTLGDRSVIKLVSTPGPNSSPVWSPDGREIAYATANGSPDFYYTNRRIAVIPAAGGTPRVITLSFDEDASPIEWMADGIYFGALHQTYAHLYRVNPTSTAVDRITQPEALIASQFSFANRAPQIAYVGAGDNTFPEVYVAPLGRPFVPKALSTLGTQMAGFRPGHRERLEWTSTDGAKVEGILTMPADFDPSKKYPLLVVIHGGPTGVDRTAIFPDRYYPVEAFVAKGALVLRPNYRGSAGYGEKFRALNVRNLGIGDYADVISGVDFLIAKGSVDRAKVGAMGWSEGGYISAFITTSSDRFRAVSVGAGISDWTTYYVNTDIHPFTRQYLKATPWDDPEIYRKTSPISYVKTAKTPTLIQHGGSDKRVPIPNGFELYQALVDLHVPVRMVVYPGFGHPIDKPKQQRSVMEENWRWFGHWIWGEPLAADQM